jgi:hypothetical protein
MTQEATVFFLSKAQLVVAFGAVALALFVLDLVRRRRLSEEYSLLWVLATVVIAVLGFSTPLLTGITRALGILYEGSTVFAFGLAFTMAMLLYLSVRLSRLVHEKDGLTREIAFLRHEVEELRRARGADRPAGGT